MRRAAQLVGPTVLLAVLAVAGVAPASAASWDDAMASSPTPPAEPPTPTADELAQSVTTYPIDGVTTFSLDGSVVPLESTEEDGGETTITLATDILFEPDAWDIPANAADRIVELVADIPDGATVEVSGHTDSVDGAVDNQELSENRADAVADVIADARPDLQLDVTGYADTRPAEPENPDDPSTYAANRRVEIVYKG